MLDQYPRAKAAIRLLAGAGPVIHNAQPPLPPSAPAYHSPPAPAIASSSSRELPPESRHNPPDSVAPPSAPRVLHPNIPRSMPAPGSCHRKPAPRLSPLASFHEFRDDQSRSPSPDARAPTSHQLEN